MDTVLLTLSVTDNVSILFARKCARHIAALLYFDSRRQTKIASVVYELLQHVRLSMGEAIITYSFSQTFSHRALKIKMMAKGYSDSSPNREVQKKLMDKVLVSVSDKGTEVIVEKNLPSKAVFISKKYLAKIVHEMKKTAPVSVFEELKKLNKELLGVLSTRSRLQEDVEKLAHAEKISSMGEMATVFAHELNQPLATIVTYIQGSIRHLKNNMFKKKEILQVMNLAVKETKRLGDFVHRIKSFVRKSDLSKENTDINQLIHETLLLLETDIKKHHVHIDIILNEYLPAIYIDAIQIKQALVNIIRTMLKAMKNAKTVSPTITIKSFMTKHHEVEINIVDNDASFKKHSTQLLFEPDLSLKQGLDMGLSIARTIVEAHEGKLLVRQNSGNGACFQCILPIKAEEKND